MALESGSNRESIGRSKGGSICPTMSEPLDYKPNPGCLVNSAR